MNKKKPLNNLIFEVISSEPIEDQLIILDRLKEKGVEITQSTLSRRLKVLGIFKRAGVYQVADAAWAGTMFALVRVDLAEPNFLILHTLPGYANALAVQIDKELPSKQQILGAGKKLYFPEILGTIAGDDTVFVLTKNSEDLQKLKKKLEDYFSA